MKITNNKEKSKGVGTFGPTAYGKGFKGRHGNEKEKKKTKTKKTQKTLRLSKIPEQCAPAC